MILAFLYVKEFRSLKCSNLVFDANDAFFVEEGRLAYRHCDLRSVLLILYRMSDALNA